MAARLIAPSMGEGVEEITIVSWLKQEGDTVEELSRLSNRELSDLGIGRGDIEFIARRASR